MLRGCRSAFQVQAELVWVLAWELGSASELVLESESESESESE